METIFRLFIFGVGTYLLITHTHDEHAAIVAVICFMWADLAGGKR